MKTQTFSKLSLTAQEKLSYALLSYGYFANYQFKEQHQIYSALYSAESVKAIHMTISKYKQHYHSTKNDVQNKTIFLLSKQRPVNFQLPFFNAD